MTTTPSPQNSNENLTSNSSTTAGTNQLLDLYIDKQNELKALVALVDDLRDQITTAIELGELDAFKTGDKFGYRNLQIQTTQRLSWKYSSAVAQLKEQEQFTGAAEKTFSNSYRFVVKPNEQS